MERKVRPKTPAASPKTTSKVTWRERMTFDAMSGTGHHFVLDAAKTAGGDDRGPRPMELVLAALAGCTAFDVISILQKKRQPVTGLEVIVEGARAKTEPRVYTEIDVLYRVCGDVSPKALAHAIELSEKKYCSVGAMLGKTAQIKTRYEIKPDDEGGSEIEAARRPHTRPSPEKTGNKTGTEGM